VARRAPRVAGRRAVLVASRPQEDATRRLTRSTLPAGRRDGLFGHGLPEAHGGTRQRACSARRDLSRELLRGSVWSFRYLDDDELKPVVIVPNDGRELAPLAARVHVNEGTLARSLLSSAIDDADPDAETVVAVLEGIDGAWERAQFGRRQAASGATILLDEF
jgi:hypothetical protein